ncbi:MAG: hypothetical protein FWF14_03360 [Streptococcaceae bacterium]|nr:hypothetical protein [Streptococcaceae bacterium]
MAYIFIGAFVGICMGILTYFLLHRADEIDKLEFIYLKRFYEIYKEKDIFDEY